MIGFDERGSLTQSTDFDFEEIDSRLSRGLPPSEAAAHPNRRAEGELVALTMMMDWIVQKVPKNQNGVEIRAVIVAWIFLPHLRTLNLTEVAAMVGRDKQSLGRWVDDFKRRFPGVHAAHTRQN